MSKINLYLCLLLLILVQPVAALSASLLAIEVNPDPVRPGEPLNIHLTVTNSGSSTMTNVELRLVYPDNVRYLDTKYISTGGASNTVSCIGDTSTTRCISSEVVVWNLGNIPAGGGVSVDMLPEVLNVADDTAITVQAEVWVDGIQTVQQIKTVTVKASPLFELSVDENIDPVTTSGDISYTLTYSNIGTTSTNTSLLLPLPDHTSFISASEGGNYSEGKVTWDLQSLPSGSGGECQVLLSVNGSEGDLIELDSLEISGTDSSFVDHTALAGRTIRLEDGNLPGLSLSVSPDPVRPQQPLKVGYTVTNPGNSPLTNVELRLRYPQHLKYIDTQYISTGGGSNSVSCVGDTSQTRCSPGEVMVWSLGTIPVGGGVAVEMLPWVLDVADGTLIQFETELRVDGIQELQRSKTVVVKTSPLFELSVDENIDPVNTSGDLFYSFTYSNTGTTSSDTSLLFPLPEHTSFVSASDGGAYSNGRVTWDLQSLPSGSGGDVKVQLSVNGSEGGLIELESLEIHGTDSSFVDHSVQVERATRMEDDSVPNMSLTLSPDPVSPQRPLKVGYTVTNPGSSPMTNVELRLRYPQHLNYIDTQYISTGGSTKSVSCIGDTSQTRCHSGEFMVWSLGTIPAGGGISVEMLPWVLDVPNGTLIQFETELWVDGIQEVQRSKTVTVKDSPVFELSVDENVDPVSTSGDLFYTFTYSNIGTTSSNTSLSFPLPEYTSFVSASEDGTYSEGRVTWNLQSLSSGSGGERKVQLSVGGSEGDMIELESLEISGTDSSYVDHAVQAGRTSRLEDDSVPGLSLAISPDPVRPQQPLKVGCTVSNPGSSPMTNVELRLRYPQHLNYIDTQYISTGGSSNTVSCIGDTSQTRCHSGEFMVWSLGTIPVGGGVSVEMLPWVLDVPDGTLIQFETELWVDGIQEVQRSKTVTVKSSPLFNLSVDEFIDPIPLSGDLIYTFMYSNVGSTSSDTSLSFELPDHTRFVSASDGGKYSAGVVTWNLGSVASGSGGERKVRLAVNGARGNLVELDALEIRGTDSSYFTHRMQASRTLRAGQDGVNGLAISLSPYPLQQQDIVNIGLTVENSASNPITNVELRLRYPQHLRYIDTPDISTGGSSNTVSCVGDTSQTRCYPGEIVVWNLGTIPAGSEVQVGMNPEVLNVPDGTQIPFEAELRVDGKQNINVYKTAFVGSNFDSTGFPPICADINNDAYVTLVDLVTVLQILAGENVSLSEHGDCNGDGIVGLPEALSILQEIQ